MNVSLGKSWEDYVARQVESGNFSDAREVVQDALPRQQEHFAKLDALRADVWAARTSLKAGDLSGADPANIRAMHAARRGSL
jgi:putative addiction module CopG family antidote